MSKNDVLFASIVVPPAIHLAYQSSCSYATANHYYNIMIPTKLAVLDDSGVQAGNYWWWRATGETHYLVMVFRPAERRMCERQFIFVLVTLLQKIGHLLRE